MKPPLSWLDVPCPKCNARPGLYCRDEAERVVGPHRERIQAARRLAQNDSRD